MKVTLDIDDCLIEAANSAATSAGCSLSAYVEKALCLHLSTSVDVIVALPVFSLGRTLPEVDLDNTAELIDIMESEEDHP